MKKTWIGQCANFGMDALRKRRITDDAAVGTESHHRGAGTRFRGYPEPPTQREQSLSAGSADPGAGGVPPPRIIGWASPPPHSPILRWPLGLSSRDPRQP